MMSRGFPKSVVLAVLAFAGVLQPADLPVLGVELVNNSSPGDDFARAVAIGGDLAVIGVPQATYRRGKIDVFVRTNGAWRLDEEVFGLLPSKHEYGSDVAVSGQTILVSAKAGEYVTALHKNGGKWRSKHEIKSPDPAVRHFGTSAAISDQGQTIVVGARGAAFVFAPAPDDDWVLQSKLPFPAYADPLGLAHVAIDADRILVGLVSQSTEGVIYAFVRSKGVWTFDGVLGGVTGHCLGTSIAIQGDTAAAGSHCSGNDTVHLWTRSSGGWTYQTAIQPQRVEPSDRFGGSVALGAGTLVIGNSGKGARFYRRTAAGWVFEAKVGDRRADTVALSEDSVLIGSADFAKDSGPQDFGGRAFVYYRSNVDLRSEPSGRSFQLSGERCPVTDTVVAPATISAFAGASCMATALSPDNGPLARYTFDRWSDQILSPSRVVSFGNLSAALTARFKAEYDLSTVSSPPSGGAVTGAGFYAASTNATVTAQPSPGFLFAGFEGDLTGSATPKFLLMDGPKSVKGVFVPLPPATLSAVVTNKAGPANLRQWTITNTNSGPGTAYSMNLGAIMLTQTFGAACAPVRLGPAALPAVLGNLAPGASLPTVVTFDMSGCPATARFTVLIVLTANNGAVAGVASYFNQMQ